MNTFTRCSMLAAMLLALAVGPAQGAMVVTHTGANDPTTEGFTLSNPSSTNSASALTPDGTTGLDAWQIVDNDSGASNAFILYEHTLTGSQLTDATNDGWRLSAKVRVPNADETPGAAIGFDFFFDGKFFRVALGSTAGGDTLVDVLASNGTFTNVDTLTGLNYHDIVLDYDPVADEVDLLIDNTLAANNLAGFTPGGSPPPGRLRFGSLSSTDTGTGNWNQVQFTIVPEPASLALLGLGGLCMLGGRFRGGRDVA